MPVKLFRNLSLSHLEGSKFDYIEKECGIIISGNYETLTPVLADKQLARSMNVPEQTPLLRITSLSYSDSGEFLTIRSCSATPASIRWTITCAASRRKAR
ncbi:HTH-type transcriptional regulator YidP [Klebsiella pneumoniae]|uniref:HTH-type transcriptional regulator YidP n=1 Tax=Klebsiella pneumoniae TaxID=573 RepID=A0A377TJD9_KLEPN|nr:HTH-type transcriptional regulator YidP [Klebsiella pneumoniae]